MAGKPTTFPANPIALDKMAPQALENIADWEAAKAKVATLEAADHTPGKPTSFPASPTGQEHMAEQAKENTADWGLASDKTDLADVIDAHSGAAAEEVALSVADVALPEQAQAHLPPTDFALPEAFYEHAGFEHASAHVPDHVSEWLLTS